MNVTQSKKQLGTITYTRVEEDSNFQYSFKISDYDAAKILEYISLRPHENNPNFRVRKLKGQFSKTNEPIGEK